MRMASILTAIIAVAVGICIGNLVKDEIEGRIVYMENTRSVYLRCDDRSETLVFSRIDFENGDTDYEVTVEDAYCRGDYMGITGRFKRAWRAFFARPISFTGVYVDDPERMMEFLGECEKLATSGTG